MSEQGWREFLAADGVDDWVVLHGGATAVFEVGSLVEAARLAEARADLVLMPYRDAAFAAAGMIAGRTEAPVSVSGDSEGQKDLPG